MIGIIFGGLLATAVFLYPALQLLRRRKWPVCVGLLMLLAGIGLCGVAFWAAGLLRGNLTMVLFVGGIALVLLAGFVIAVVADLSDKKLDQPWLLFVLPSLVAVVALTGSQTVDFIGGQIERNVSTISSQVE